MCTVDTSSEQLIIRQKLLLLFTDIKSNGILYQLLAQNILTFIFSMQQHNIISMSWSLLVQWVTDFILCITSAVNQQTSLKTRVSPLAYAMSHRLMFVTSLLTLVLREIWERRRHRLRSSRTNCLSIKPMVAPLVLCAHCYPGDNM